MKTMKKLLAIFLALAMLIAMMSFTAFAADGDEGGEGGTTGDGGSTGSTVNITINQDSTYAGTAGQPGRNYHWYLVFTAVPDDEFTGDEGGGYDPDTGLPGEVTGDEDHGVAYTASAAVAAKLGEWVDAVGTPGTADYVAAHWESVAGNKWFTLTPIVGTDTFSVAWTAEIPEGQENAGDPDRSSETAQAAARWLLENEVYDEDGELTWDAENSCWTATVDPGYYLIQAYGESLDDDSSGVNLIAATTDMEIDEKNAYPPIVKQQKDEDYEQDEDETTDDEYTDETVDVAIGDVIEYEVTVTIPVTAKIGDTIEVWDKPSDGLTYNDDMVITVNGVEVDPEDADSPVVARGTLESGDIWRYVITVDEDNIGKDVVFTFSMTVNENALVDDGRENTSGLIYGNEYDSLPQTVEYKTYFAGIHKYDPATNEDLEGVKFTLMEDGVPFPVKLTADGYYIPDTSIVQGSDESDDDFAARVLEAATVETDEDGMIYIRGLDEDKTYTLSETYALPGYNMLDDVVTLTLTEDTPAKDAVADDPSTPDVDESQDAVEASFEAAKDDGTDDTYWVQVENNKGTILPATGGIGTAIFYIVGALLVIGAGVILVARRRMSVQ